MFLPGTEISVAGSTASKKLSARCGSRGFVSSFATSLTRFPSPFTSTFSDHTLLAFKMYICFYRYGNEKKERSEYRELYTLWPLPVTVSVPLEKTIDIFKAMPKIIKNKGMPEQMTKVFPVRSAEKRNGYPITMLEPIFNYKKMNHTHNLAFIKAIRKNNQICSTVMRWKHPSINPAIMKDLSPVLFGTKFSYKHNVANTGIAESGVAALRSIVNSYNAHNVRLDPINKYTGIHSVLCGMIENPELLQERRNLAKIWRNMNSATYSVHYSTLIRTILSVDAYLANLNS